jgi:hypothetical protein
MSDTFRHARGKNLLQQEPFDDYPIPATYVVRPVTSDHTLGSNPPLLLHAAFDLPRRSQRHRPTPLLSTQAVKRARGRTPKGMMTEVSELSVKAGSRAQGLVSCSQGRRVANATLPVVKKPILDQPSYPYPQTPVARAFLRESL